MPSLAKHDPLAVPASREEINEAYSKLESSPIYVFDKLIDCNDKSLSVMKEAIDHWDDFELQAGVFEEVEVNGKAQRVIVWKMGDNTIEHLSRVVLINLYEETARLRVLRRAKLFASLQRFKSDPQTTVRAIQNPENWAG